MPIKDVNFAYMKNIIFLQSYYPHGLPAEKGVMAGLALTSCKE